MKESRVNVSILEENFIRDNDTEFNVIIEDDLKRKNKL